MMTSVACEAIQGLVNGSSGNRRSTANKTTTPTRSWRAKRRLSDSILSRDCAAGERFGTIGALSCRLDIAAFLDPDQALWPEREQQHDQRERCWGLEMRAEVPAG